MNKPRKVRAPSVQRRLPEGRNRPTKNGIAPQEQVPPDLSRITPGLRCLAVPIGDLSFHPKNPRAHSESNISAIRSSLRVNGQYQPLVASTRTGQLVVVVGNGRLAAAVAEGWTHIAVEPKQMSEARENQLIVMDNRSAETAGWNDEALLAALRDVDTACDADMDACLAGLAEARKLLPPKEGWGLTAALRGGLWVGRAFSIVDIDCYGSPWRFLAALFCHGSRALTDPCVVVLTDNYMGNRNLSHEDLTLGFRKPGTPEDYLARVDDLLKLTVAAQGWSYDRKLYRDGKAVQHLVTLRQAAAEKHQMSLRSCQGNSWNRVVSDGLAVKLGMHLSSVRGALLPKKGNASSVTASAHVSRPLQINRAVSGATFSADDNPINSGQTERVSKRAEGRLIADEADGAVQVPDVVGAVGVVGILDADAEPDAMADFGPEVGEEGRHAFGALRQQLEDEAVIVADGVPDFGTDGV